MEESLGLELGAWPTLLLVGGFVAAVGLLLPRNGAAIRVLLRPSSSVAAQGARPAAKLAWLVSFAALFTGPLAPLTGSIALVFGLLAMRAVRTSPLRDPQDALLAKCAALNGAVLAALSLLVVVAVRFAPAAGAAV